MKHTPDQLDAKWRSLRQHCGQALNEIDKKSLYMAWTYLTTALSEINYLLREDETHQPKD